MKMMGMEPVLALRKVAFWSLERFKQVLVGCDIFFSARVIADERLYD